MTKFKLGTQTMTMGINNSIAEDVKFAKEIVLIMSRYLNRDWGEICEEDKQMSDDALKNGDDRIFAAYDTSRGKVFVITEWDRSVTTILFANEY